MSRAGNSAFPSVPSAIPAGSSLLAGLPGHLAPGGGSQQQASGSVVTSASNLGSLPGHLEIGRQLDGAFEEELRKLERLGEAFYDELEGTMSGASDAQRCRDALKTLQSQLAHVISLSRAGLGAIPLPFPPASLPTNTPAAPGFVQDQPQEPPVHPVAALDPTLEAFTERWAADLQGLFGRRQAFREGVSVAEGVFKRAA